MTVLAPVPARLRLSDLARLAAVGLRTRKLRAALSALGIAIGESAPLAQVRAAVLEQRKRRGMVLDDADHDTWSAGSFFTNPILEPEQFAALHQMIKPQPGEAPWAKVPWQTNLAEARKMAVAEDRPLLVWRAGGGLVLGRV